MRLRSWRRSSSEAAAGAALARACAAPGAGPDASTMPTARAAAKRRARIPYLALPWLATAAAAFATASGSPR